MLFIIVTPQEGDGGIWQGFYYKWDFTTNLATQCRAFSRALKIETLKAPLIPSPEGRGIQMTGA